MRASGRSRSSRHRARVVVCAAGLASCEGDIATGLPEGGYASALLFRLDVMGEVVGQYATTYGDDVNFRLNGSDHSLLAMLYSADLETLGLEPGMLVKQPPRCVHPISSQGDPWKIDLAKESSWTLLSELPQGFDPPLVPHPNRCADLEGLTVSYACYDDDNCDSCRTSVTVGECSVSASIEAPCATTPIQVAVDRLGRPCVFGSLAECTLAEEVSGTHRVRCRNEFGKKAEISIRFSKWVLEVSDIRRIAVLPGEAGSHQIRTVSVVGERLIALVLDEPCPYPCSLISSPPGRFVILNRETLEHVATTRAPSGTQDVSAVGDSSFWALYWSGSPKVGVFSLDGTLTTSIAIAMASPPEPLQFFERDTTTSTQGTRVAFSLRAPELVSNVGAWVVDLATRRVVALDASTDPDHRAYRGLAFADHDTLIRAKVDRVASSLQLANISNGERREVVVDRAVTLIYPRHLPSSTMEWGVQGLNLSGRSIATFSSWRSGAVRRIASLPAGFVDPVPVLSIGGPFLLMIVSHEEMPGLFFIIFDLETESFSSPLPAPFAANRSLATDEEGNIYGVIPTTNEVVKFRIRVL